MLCVNATQIELVNGILEFSIEEKRLLRLQCVEHRKSPIRIYVVKCCVVILKKI